MKSWKGLLRKERVLMRRGIFTLAFITGILAEITSISRIFGEKHYSFDNTLIIMGTWLAFSTFIGVWMLYTSLRREMKRPDIWLHSSASMVQLVGVKVIFAAIITAFSLVLNGLFVGISFYLSGGSKVITLSAGALPLLSVIIAVFLNSIYVMAIGFFLWSIYHVLRARIGRFSVVATFAIFFACAYLWEKFRVSEAFDAIKKFGPVKITDVPFYTESNGYFFMGIAHEGVIFSMGSLLVYGTLTVVLFVVGTLLFEKKVRL